MLLDSDSSLEKMIQPLETGNCFFCHAAFTSACGGAMLVTVLQ